MQQRTDFGFWNSSVQPRPLVRMRELKVSGDCLYWIESRPSEGGRQTLMSRSSSGEVVEILPLPHSVRTRVHEYGGGAYTIGHDAIYFISGKDGSLQWLDPKTASRLRLAHDPQAAWADLEYDPHHSVLWAVEERDSDRGIVRLPIAPGRSATSVVRETDSFFASPRISPDGKQLAWLCWRRPYMPWDQTELWVADITPEADLRNVRQVFAKTDVALVQPEWSAAGELHVLCDASEGGDVYVLRADTLKRVTETEGDAFLAHWVFGQSAYAITPQQEIYVAPSRNGVRALTIAGAESPIVTELTDISYLRAFGEGVAFIGSSFSQTPGLWTCDARKKTHCVWRPEAIDSSEASIPESRVEPTTGAHYFYYPPRSAQIRSVPDGLPPLILQCHGGPTASASSALDLGIVYWTSRGFAVAEVNYRGSTGFGRKFRQSLLGKWGLFDVEDCCAVARSLQNEALVDPTACFVRGSSSGGLTVLRALMSPETPFVAGVGYYPVTDLVALSEQTHGFEYDYVTRLVGDSSQLVQRSPFAHAEQITRPLLLLHGTEDRVVPPSQSKELANLMSAQGTQCKTLFFDGEGHGFRKEETVRASLEAELAFYQSFLKQP